MAAKALPRRLGSSPHTRGAHSRSDPLGGPRGIIPAYAGSTSDGPGKASSSSDHPRIRGEHFQFGGGVVVAGGSSPHTRGAQDTRKGALLLWRIIPAYAGSTETTLRWRHSPPDHPRIRGEHYAAHKVAIETGGSSPHTRGARDVTEIQTGGGGIIPAYAGSTTPPGDSMRVLRDHPRIRGEHGGAE